MWELTESCGKMKTAECSVYLCLCMNSLPVRTSFSFFFISFQHCMSIQMQTVRMQPHTWGFQMLFEHALMQLTQHVLTMSMFLCLLFCHIILPLLLFVNIEINVYIFMVHCLITLLMFTLRIMAHNRLKIKMVSHMWAAVLLHEITAYLSCEHSFFQFWFAVEHFLTYNLPPYQNHTRPLPFYL